MKFDIMVRPLEVLVVIVVDHLEVEGEVGAVSEATALLVVVLVVLSLVHAVLQLLLNLLDLFSHPLNLHLKTLLVLLSPESALHGVSRENFCTIYTIFVKLNFRRLLIPHIRKFQDFYLIQIL